MTQTKFAQPTKKKQQPTKKFSAKSFNCFSLKLKKQTFFWVALNLIRIIIRVQLPSFHFFFSRSIIIAFFFYRF